MKVTSVAVVIPFYNGSAFIERAIASVHAQTVKAKELIIVDDGSRPEEAKVLAALKKKYGFTLLTKANGGQGSARNYGVAKAKSDFICLLDQDDYFLEWHIEELIAAAEARADERFSVAYGDVWRCEEDGTVIDHAFALKFGEHPKTNLYQEMKGALYILPSATLMSKRAFQSIGGYDERLKGYEDDDLFLRFLAAGFTTVCTERAVTCWTRNSSSTSYSMTFARSRWIFVQKLLSDYPSRPRFSLFVMKDYVLPRFLPNFISDYLRACLVSPGDIVETKERLAGFRDLIVADPFCAHLRRTNLSLKFILWLSPRSMVALGRFVSSRIGGALLGPIGKRKFVPMIRRFMAERRSLRAAGTL